MYKAIAILVLFLLAALTMLVLILVFHSGPLPEAILEYKTARLRREMDRRPRSKVDRNWTIAGQGEGCPFPRTYFADFVETGLGNATVGVFPSKTFFELDLTSRCTETVFPPRRVTVVEVSRSANQYLVDVSLQPIQLIVDEAKDELGKEFLPNKAKYWYIYPAPVDPFECYICRTQVSVELYNKTTVKYLIESVGVIQNDFPTFIDVTKPETMRRAYKENFETAMVSVEAKRETSIHIVDISYFAHRDHYLLVGVSPLDKDGRRLSYWSANESVAKALLDLKSDSVPKVHYALCVTNYTSTYYYQTNCYPRVSIKRDDNGLAIFADGDCICWQTSTIKSIFLFGALTAVIVLIVIALLWRTRKLIRRPVEKVGSNFIKSQCKFVYNVHVRLALPSTRRIRGNLIIRFLEDEDTNVTSFVVNEKDKFHKPFLGSNEVAELQVKLLTEKELPTPKQARAVYCAESDKYDTLYMFGIAFSDKDRKKMAVFPYSHYLGDQRPARLAEAQVWLRKLRMGGASFDGVQLPISIAPWSLALLEHTYMILASLVLLPRFIYVGLAREDSIIFTVAWSAAFNIALYFANYIVYTHIIKQVFVDRYFFIQAVPRLGESLELSFGIFWVFALLLYLHTFIEVTILGRWITPMRFSEAKTFEQTIWKKDVTWLVLILVTAVIQFSVIAITFAWLRWRQNKPKISLGPIASLDERGPTVRSTDISVNRSTE